MRVSYASQCSCLETAGPMQRAHSRCLTWVNVGRALCTYGNFARMIV